MIAKLLSTAIKLYLRSQISQVQDLQIKVGGKNRQILQGYIPLVFLSCKQGIYQGLHLREVKVSGKDIAFNLPEVLKKKPLRLLEPIIVEVELNLSEGDLIASIDSDLFQSGLTDLWQIILKAGNSPNSLVELDTTEIHWKDIGIANGQLTIAGTYQNRLSQAKSLNLTASVWLDNSHVLCLSSLEASDESQKAIVLKDNLFLDLGKDVEIEELFLTPDRLFCAGKIKVRN